MDRDKATAGQGQGQGNKRTGPQTDRHRDTNRQ
jgi:hypothetical protein